MSNTYEMALLGPISRDYNIEPDGEVHVEIGGAIMYSPYGAKTAGVSTIAVVKGNLDETDLKQAYKDFTGELLQIKGSSMTSIENQYLDVSHEERISKMISQADPFTMEDICHVKADLFHLGGLIYGDFSDQFILDLAKDNTVALDAQCLLRHGCKENGKMTYEDWTSKADILPYIKYLKVDAKEAYILTGLKDRYEAAKKLYQFGAKEIFISFHNQMLVYDGKTFYTCDYEQTNLIGRTGRGDTVFATYLGMRLHHDIKTALRFATSLVMLKMTKRGPFRGTKQMVMDHAKEVGLTVREKIA